jgi:Putative abortive phage resistance protein AbiGi, antitoxin
MKKLKSSNGQTGKGLDLRNKKFYSMAADISSDYLYHFTGSFENLLSIINNRGFIPNYCLENWSKLDKEMPHIGIPMICFSDISDNFIGPHKLKYGPYGLALEKQWGVDKGLTPVAYVHKGSQNYKSINFISKIIQEQSESLELSDRYEVEKKGDLTFYKSKGIIRNLNNAFFNLFCLFKPYIGDDFSGKDVCFYDEREWRYYPFGVTPPFLKIEEYSMDENGKYFIPIFQAQAHKDNLKKYYTLNFPEIMVTKIFVETEQEKQKLMKIERFNSTKIQVENNIVNK